MPSKKFKRTVSSLWLILLASFLQQVADNFGNVGALILTIVFFCNVAKLSKTSAPNFDTLKNSQKVSRNFISFWRTFFKLLCPILKFLVPASYISHIYERLASIQLVDMSNELAPMLTLFAHLGPFWLLLFRLFRESLH